MPTHGRQKIASSQAFVLASRYTNSARYTSAFCFGCICGWAAMLIQLGGIFVAEVRARAWGLDTWTSGIGPLGGLVAWALIMQPQARVSGIQRTTTMIENFPDMISSTISFAARGWPVFPLKGKVPLTKHGFKDASTDLGKIEEWWGQNPSSNIGIATGQLAGFFVLDIDGPEGQRTLSELQGLYGALPSTVTAATGNGMHYYFRYPEGDFRNSTGKIGAGIDIRATGGYVVAPPSRHPSGKLYAWLPGLAPGETGLASAPDWLIDLMKSPQRPDLAYPLVTGAVGSMASLSGLTTMIIAAPDGQQEAILNQAAYIAGRMIANGEVKYETAKQELLVAAERMPDYDSQRPWLKHQLIEKVERGLNDGMRGKGASFLGARAHESANEPDFALTDAGNAERLKAHCRQSLCFVPGIGWHFWDGRRWRRDDTNMSLHFALKVVRTIGDGNVSPEKAKWAKTSESRDRLHAALSLAEPLLAVLPDKLDSDLTSINCKNGIVDLRTGFLSPHRPDAYHSKLIDIAYDPNATAPMFEKFMSDIFAGNQELIDFVARAAGYSLTGLSSEQVMLILYGKGANGKSTFFEIMADVFGEYAQNAPSSMLLAKNGNQSVPVDVARLRGARFVTMAETDSGERLNESLVKQLTGADRITARFMRQNFFEFSPQHTLWMATNNKPDVIGTDEGIWRRLLLVPFNVQFVSEPADGQKKKDPTLVEKLKRELPGIFAWLVRGAVQYFEKGLAPPDIVKQETAKYRSESDLLGDFINSCCDVHNSFSASVKDLYESFRTYCELNAEVPKSVKWFGSGLGNYGFRRDQFRGRVRYHGLRLKDVTQMHAADGAEEVDPSDRTEIPTPKF